MRNRMRMKGQYNAQLQFNFFILFLILALITPLRGV